MPEIQPILQAFTPISLKEMDDVALQDRTDTKYVFAERDLAAVLRDIQPHYRLLEVNGQRGTDYRSLYYDTADHRDFLDHQNGRVLRSKTRFREYVGSDLYFLEVKRKTGRGRTNKLRRRVQGIPEELSAEQAAFIAEATGRADRMMPALWNAFTRLTFVRKDRPERLTMDIGLRFHVPGRPDRDVPLVGIVVAELKQERMDRLSPFALAMRRAGNRPAGMSKYCIGMLMVREGMKYNAFKQVLLRLDDLRKAA